MVKPEEVLTLIPARGGSKSIPRKNIGLFAGHPLIAYSIAAGLQALSVTRVIVSTDDEELAEVARRCGAETPFLRPETLAQDDTLDLPVFQHALRWLDQKEGYRPDIVVQLRPTSPLRPRDLVDRAVALLADRPEADSVRGVVPSAQNPYKMWRLADDGRILPLLSDAPTEAYNMPRQKLPATYWQTGHIDAIRPAVILGQGSMSGRTILPVMIDPRYSVDIDNPRDWARAEWMLTAGELDAVLPGRAPRAIPRKVELLVLDFDGVMTDDRVWVDGTGTETVASHRGDGLGLAGLKRAGIPAIVLSTETNPVVAARCQKLELPFVQGVADKRSALRSLLEERGVNPAAVVYLGNDVNDLACFSIVGCAVVVGDAHPLAKASADIILSRPGGQGAVRELCDRLVAVKSSEEAHA